MRIRTGDTVIILSGQHKRQTGKVTATFPQKNLVMVSGINVKTKHRKPISNTNRGGIEKAEHPLPVSKVALVRPGAKQLGSRIGYKLAKDGSKKRVLSQAGRKEIK